MEKTPRNPCRSRVVFGLAALSLMGLLVACSGDTHGTAPARSGTLKVVATTGMIGDTAARIGGDHVAVDTLMGPGVDPHLFKASEGDVRRLAEADLVLYNGLHLEGKMGDILVKLARSRPVVAVSEEVPVGELREPPEFLGQYDPHIWFDVSLWAQTLSPVAKALAELDPGHAAEFIANAEQFGEELSQLDGWAKARIQEVPPERRVLVTAHDAFGYFGRRYGMQVVGLQGISTLSEPGLRDMDRVAELVSKREIPAIFVESSVPRRAIDAVVAACAARGHTVQIGGELFSDAMGAAGSEAGTYPGMVRFNVNTIVEALQ